MARKKIDKPANKTENDAALWDMVADSIKPLKNRPPRSPEAPSPDPVPETPPAAAVKPARKQPVRRGPPAPPRKPAMAELQSGKTAGIDKRTATRLKRGKMQIDGRIDLHGMSRAEAHSNLVRFLMASAAQGRRCVLVITGKGGRGGVGAGILRTELPRWLNLADLRPHILSFTEAQPKDGGGGAFYVYLRRARDPAKDRQGGQ